MGIICDRFKRAKYTYEVNMPYRDGLYTGFVDNKLRPCTTYGELQFTHSEYHGGFHKGLYHGDGTFRWSSGDYYSGEWTHGKKNGTGVMYIKSTNVIHTGRWKNDQLEA